MRIGSILGSGQATFSTDSNWNVPVAPAISFNGDPDTGIYNIAANTIGFATQATERLRIASNGLVTAAGDGSADNGYAALVTAGGAGSIPNKQWVNAAITTGASLALDDLTNVVDTSAAANEFLVSDGALSWVTQDAAAQRTSLGMDAGGAGDIWVEKAGDTMDSGANITFVGGGKVTGLIAATAGATDATSKAYVDAAISGLGWVAPIADPDLAGIAPSDPNATPDTAVLGTGYVAYSGGSYPQTWTNDTSAGGTVGGIAKYDYVYLGTDGIWFVVGNIAAAVGVSEVRFGVAFEHGTATASLTGINIDDNDLVEYIGGSSGDPTAESSWSHPQGHAGDPAHNFTGVSVTVATKTFKVSGDQTLDFFPNNRLVIAGTTAADAEYTIDTVTFNTPDTDIVVTTAVSGSDQTVAFTATSEIWGGTTTLCNAVNSAHLGHSYTYNEDTNVWNEVGGPSSIGAGDGLSYSGSTLNVGLGAGITALPNDGDHVGVDLYTNSGLLLTSDGTTQDLTATGKLIIDLDGSTLALGASGISVDDGGITETQLNTSVAGSGITGGGGTILSVDLSTNSGLELTGASPAGTLNLNIGGLATSGAAITGTDVIAVERSAGSDDFKYSLDAVVEGMDIPHGITGDGFVVRTAADAYTNRSIAVVTTAGALEGLSIADADGVSANPTIGLDINGNTAATSNLIAGDKLMVWNTTDGNVAMTGTQLAAGLSTLLTIDNTRITDGASTWIDTDAPAVTLASSVGAGSTHAASTPFTMSADAGIDFTTSTASATNSAGAPFTITSGNGDGNGAGGLIDLEGGVGGGTGPGGAINVTGGTGGAAGNGGAVTVAAGAGGTAGNGGVLTLSSGSGSVGTGGALNITAGSGSTVGGNVTITAGGGGTGSAGSLFLTGGDGNLGQDAYLRGGAGATSAGGDVHLQPGAGNTTEGLIYVGPTADGTGDAAEMRFREAAAGGSDYIGLKAPAAITTAVTYTLPIAPAGSNYVLTSTTGGVMSWITSASVSGNNYAGITGDGGGGATAGSNGATFSLVGATDGGIVTNASGTPGTVTFALDINDLAAGGTMALTDIMAVEEAGGTNVQNTLQDLVEDLDIPNAIASLGIVSRHDTDAYDSVTIAAAGTGTLEGITVANGGGHDGGGASANPTIGLNITGMTAATVDMDATDKFVVFDGSNNVSMVGQDIADGVKTILGLDNTIITDSDGTFVDTDATTSTITSGVKAVGNFAAGTPLTLSAASTLITSSDGTANNPGAPISITSGAGGETSGVGGALSITSGAGAATGDGGLLTITGGAGGATSGNGGDLRLYGGTSTSGLGGDVEINGAARTAAGSPGAAKVNGGYGGSFGNGGRADVIGGGTTAASAVGGEVNLLGGNNTGGASGVGGAVNITAGDATGTTSTGGSVILQAGAGTSTDGTVDIIGADTGVSGELRFHESNAVGDHIGLKAPTNITTSIVYTLPENVTNGYVLQTNGSGVMTWVNPVAAGSTNSFGVITTDGDTATADSATDTVSMTGATNGGIVTAGTTGASAAVTFAMDVIDLTDAQATQLVLGDFMAVGEVTGSATVRHTYTDMVEDLQIPNAVGTSVGFVTLDGSNSYATHTLSAEGAGNLSGVAVSAGGTSGAADVTIGLDILNLAAAIADLATGDLIPVYDLSATSNRKMTGQELADGVASLISLDTTKIVDADGDTWIDVENGSDTDTIESAVAAGTTNAAGTPLTMSADGGSLITSSAGTSGNAGGVISLTAGAGEGIGAGGAVSATSGAGGANGAGGALTLIAGAGGSTSGAGGAVTLTGGAGSGSTGGVGGAVTITGGSGKVTSGGDASICGGDGVGVDGGDATLCGGDSDTAAGGSIILQPGSGATDGTISVSAGTSATEMRFYDIAADNYVGFRAADVLTANTSWIWPTADGSTSGDVLITDAAGNLSFAAAGSSLTAGEGIDISTSTISLDIGGLSAETITTSDELAFWDVSGTPNNDKTTVANFIADLDVVTTPSITTGLITKTADDTYLGRSVVPSTAAALQGIDVVNQNGVSGDITVGLNISGLDDEAGTPSSTDSVALYDGTNNVEATLAQINSGMRLEDLADVVASTDTSPDAAGRMLVSDGTNSYDAKKIQHVEAFTSSSTWAVTHNLGQQFVIVQCYDGSNVQIIPASVTLTSSTVTTITFAVPTAGTVVIMGVAGATSA